MPNAHAPPHRGRITPGLALPRPLPPGHLISSCCLVPCIPWCTNWYPTRELRRGAGCTALQNKPLLLWIHTRRRVTEPCFLCVACTPQVQWEECWWKASNRYGLRELGAFKKGTAESGAAWVEEWKEVLYTHPTNLRLVIERTAHKWVLALVALPFWHWHWRRYSWGRA